MKVLVTGATGFIGSFVAEYFLNEGFDVRCTVRPTSSLRWLKDKPLTTVETTFETPESLQEAVQGVDYIVHIAGTIAEFNFQGYLRGNRDVTYNLLRAAEIYNPSIKKFLFVSSQTAVGPSLALDMPVDETTECKPITRYGRSKLEAEKEVLKFKDVFPVTIIRLPAVYGPRDTALVDMFRIVRKRIAPIIGFTEKYISIIHSDDVARGIYVATVSEQTNGEILFLSSDKYYSWSYLIKEMQKAIGKKAITLRVPHLVVFVAGFLSELFGYISGKAPVFNYEKAKDFTQKYWICSAEKARKMLGFSPKVSIEQGFRSTYKWYVDNGWI